MTPALTWCHKFNRQRGIGTGRHHVGIPGAIISECPGGFVGISNRMQPTGWHSTDEISFFACQIRLSASATAAAIRRHWGIENRSHYVRDVSFFEDHSRIRNKPGHFARFRSFALNILRANGATNVSRELYINALNPHHALAYRSA